MAVYFEKFWTNFRKKLHESRHNEIDIVCLNVRIECKNFLENICDPLLCVKRILGISCTIINWYGWNLKKVYWGRIANYAYQTSLWFKNDPVLLRTMSIWQNLVVFDILPTLSFGSKTSRILQQACWYQELAFCTFDMAAILDYIWSLWVISFGDRFLLGWVLVSNTK